MFYKFWRSLIVGLAYVVFAVRVRGRERVPRTGVYILAPSHRSLLDIPFAATVTRRRLRFMAKKEIFSTPFGSWVFNQLGAVAVDRNSTDRAALKALEAALREGEPVVIFPEGTRLRGPEIGALASGAAYVALKVGVTIVPVGVGGSEHPVVRRGCFPWWSRVTVVVGEPIVVEHVTGTVKRSAITALDTELRARIQACFDEAAVWSAERSAGGPRRAGQPSQRV